MLHDDGERHQGNVEFCLVFHIGVDRHEVVFSFHLEPVTCIEDQRNVGILGGAAEASQGHKHCLPVKIRAAEDLEAEFVELDAHVGGVIARVSEPRNCAVLAVADHQCNALLGPRGSAA